MINFLKFLFIVIIFNYSFGQSFTVEKVKNSYQIREVWGCEEEKSEGWYNLYKIINIENYFSFYNETNQYKIIKVIYNKKPVNIDINQYNLFRNGEYYFTLSKDELKFIIKIIFKDNQIEDIIFNNKSIISQ